MKIRFSIKRRPFQTAPDYWDHFEFNINKAVLLTDVYNMISAFPVNIEGRAVSPVVRASCQGDENCGKCHVKLNGRDVLACKEIIDPTVACYTLEPYSEQSVIKDLLCESPYNRLVGLTELSLLSTRMDINAQSYRQPDTASQKNDQLLACIDCGICSSVCPQEASPLSAVYVKQYQFLGGNRSLPQVESLAQLCDNTQNCVRSCPSNIPLMNMMGQIKRATTLKLIKNLIGIEL